jgi:GNAT superfamily N-acetyltransferase
VSTDRRPPVALVLVPALDGAALASVRDLFLEYQRSLDVDLCFQDFAAELAALPGAYAPPAGRLYLGLSNGEPACCVALRRLDAATAEMKRLYVRPAFRGRGYGGVLARTVIADAAATGCARVVLDTLPAMGEAQALYAALGFRDIPAYTFNPVAGTRFMGLALAPARPGVA